MESRQKVAPESREVERDAARVAVPRRALLRAAAGATVGTAVTSSLRALGTAAAAGLGMGSGCRCRRAAGGPDATGSKGASPTPATSGRWVELRFDPAEAGGSAQLALLLEERDRPLLVALHGRGESVRGLEAGARGWRDDYDLDRADERLRSPPLGEADLLGLVRPDRLAALNASLARHPYEGLAVVCPYTPDLADRSLAGLAPFGTFVLEALLPRVARRLDASALQRAGIDGVSLGGRYALLIGLSHPDRFHSVSALQPAIRETEAEELGALAHRAVAQGLRHLRLVTSDDDYFRPAVEELSAVLRRDAVPHELLVTPGPHDYVYNRGPGSFEMLLWHERVLRALPSP